MGRIVVMEYEREREATDQLEKSEWLQCLLSMRKRAKKQDQIRVVEMRPFYTRAQLARTDRRGPLSLVLVNAHVLSEIVVAAECLATIRE